MGALPSETEAQREAIATALNLKHSGNALPFLRMQHALSQKDSVVIADIFLGLTHFSAKLHADDAQARDIRLLTDAALAVDLSALATSTNDGALSPALHAHHLFVVNLVSANPAYIEPVLDMFAARAFLLSSPSRSAVVKCAYASIAEILNAYPRATSVLSDVLRARYPHPVRPAAEHGSYARSVLHVARECRNAAVSRSIIAMVMEKVGAIEALVPEQIFTIPLESPLKIENSSVQSEGLVLQREAEKIETVLLELIRHVILTSKAGEPEVYRLNFESMFAAYESSIVPIEGTRFSPYVMLCAASKGGEAVMLDLVERLRHSFCDTSISERLREKYLQHSSAMVIRSRLLSPEAAMKWISSLARWLNRYVDVRERRVSFGTIDIDTDVHRLFYSACCALMTTVVGRKDAFSGREAGSCDSLDRMRLYRIMSCSLNPLLVSPSAIVQEFADVVEKLSGMDLTDIIDENKGKYTPSRTKYGARNEFSYTVRAPELELNAVRVKLEGFIRFNETSSETDDDEEMTEAPFFAVGGIPVGICGRLKSPDMILSRSQI